MFTGYRDVAVVGEGGLGRVYRAVKESTGGVVAIKELREVPSASPAWHRAQRELQAMLRLKGHPYVVSIEEILEGPNGPCLVMEYLEGGSLSERLAAGPLTFAEAVLVGQHVTQALGAAHMMGIVHRDVKPHNLLIGSFGQVKVADFGIAALTRESGFHTRTQSLTLAYASPEELDGEDTVGPPADVYSFAATMSHLLTGRKPSVRVRSIADDLAALQPVPPAVQPLIAALLRCLSADPAARPTMPELESLFLQASVSLGGASLSRLDRSTGHSDNASDEAATIARSASPPVPPRPAEADRSLSSQREVEQTVLRPGSLGGAQGSGPSVSLSAGTPPSFTQSGTAVGDRPSAEPPPKVRRSRARKAAIAGIAVVLVLFLAGVVAGVVSSAVGGSPEGDSPSMVSAPRLTLLDASRVGVGYPGVDVVTFSVIQLREGTGPEAQSGDSLLVHYVARRSIDGHELDNYYEQGEALQFVLGQGEVIAAWDEGLIGSSRGGLYRIDVPGLSGSDDVSFMVQILAVK